MAVPRADTPLEGISHPLLAKATERFADDQTPHERIAAIDDEVLFKVKAQRWRGAIWVDAGIPWLVAAGWREEGSPEDFYASLAARGKTARARYNAEHSPPLTSTTYIADLRPAATTTCDGEPRQQYGPSAGSGQSCTIWSASRCMTDTSTPP
jgi:hypothetical protein